MNQERTVVVSVATSADGYVARVDGGWVMGGAGLIGECIPLLAPRHRLVRLQLVSVRKFKDGVARLHYAVERPGRRDKS